ncbi:MAG: ribonuclease P protein component [Pseudomonadota bacterium]
MAASGSAPEPSGACGAALARPRRLKKRRDFLAAARASKWTTPSFVLQARWRESGHDDARHGSKAQTGEAASGTVRLGFTASKKVGGAVQRNRAKRRLRAAGEPIVAAQGRPGWDYVLIARAEVTASRPFEELQADLRWAMEQVHTARAAEKGRRGPRDGRKGSR